ncbi:MAG: hypothetical protein ACYDH6_01050 [Acidimicrobiales bacterium]
MTSSLTRRLAATAMVVAAVALSACSSSSKSSSSSASATTASPPTTAASSATTIDPALRAQAQNALLVPSDVGPGFTSGTYTPGDPTKPEPCGQPNISTKFPEVLKVGASIVQGQTLDLEEELIFFSDQPTTDGAIAAGIAGVSCPQGTFYGSDGTPLKVAITGPTDVTAQVGGTKAVQLQIKADQVQGTLIAVEYKTAIVTFAFLADVKADLSTAPDPIAIVKKGVAKVAAA